MSYQTLGLAPPNASKEGSRVSASALHAYYVGSEGGGMRVMFLLFGFGGDGAMVEGCSSVNPVSTAGYCPIHDWACASQQQPHSWSIAAGGRLPGRVVWDGDEGTGLMQAAHFENTIHILAPCKYGETCGRDGRLRPYTRSSMFGNDKAAGGGGGTCCVATSSPDLRQECRPPRQRPFLEATSRRR